MYIFSMKNVINGKVDGVSISELPSTILTSNYIFIYDDFRVFFT